MIKVFGLKNCVTCGNALKWLKETGFIHEFPDICVYSIDADAVSRWISAVGWDALLNMRSTTWRSLPDEKKAIFIEQDAMELMLENRTLIKRPVFESGHQIVVGFKDAQKAVLEKQR